MFIHRNYLFDHWMKLCTEGLPLGQKNRGIPPRHNSGRRHTRDDADDFCKRKCLDERDAGKPCMGFGKYHKGGWGTDKTGKYERR